MAFFEELTKKAKGAAAVAADKAKDAAELDQVWRDQVEDMILTEVLRRENLTALAAAKGKESPLTKEKSVTEKMQARVKRMRNEDRKSVV